jgi:hypothetical protein
MWPCKMMESENAALCRTGRLVDEVVDVNLMKGAQRTAESTR